ncbi:MAG: alpha-glucan family phosphorylase [Phycisphaerales bacterium]|nr:alpha-glucan family phosphorylase [Phycisphaerales bacterium]
MRDQNRLIAYFSMEIGLEPHIPTYSGGLGVLAGDTLRAAADMGLPYAGVTLLYRDGYFTQRLEGGRQVEVPTAWKPEETLEEMPQRGYVPIEGRVVLVRAYRLILKGATGRYIPIYFLDTDLPENTPDDRKITRALYTGNSDWRIKQEAILGIGGRRMLRAFTHDVACFHMNEGHAVFLTVELLSEHLARFDKSQIDSECIRHARQRCVFTTHTPIEAGHDRFPIDRVRAIIGDHPVFHRPDLYGSEGTLNTTILALNMSRFANGVARKHGEVSRSMFPNHTIDSITNGVHAASWACGPVARLFDHHFPAWRTVNSELRLARGIPDDELWDAHQEAKHDLLDAVETLTDEPFDPDVFTIGFARRATAYKRAAMLISDPARLRTIARSAGRLQILYAGKAHPHDGAGKAIIAEINQAIAGLNSPPDLRIAFLPNYDIALARKLVAGCDMWLNTPEPPLEASGTSGMKAALNGVPSFSTMDGWWIEGCVEGETGWGIGDIPTINAGLAGQKLGVGASESLFRHDAEELYRKLEHTIVPLYYGPRHLWIDVMKSAISINGSHFTTERMLRDYMMKAYDD